MIEQHRQPKQVIAVVTDALAPFHRKVLDAAAPHFTAAGFGTLCVAGRDVSTQRFDVHDTQTPELLVRQRQLDIAGAVVVSGATPPGTPDDEIAAFVSELTTGPVVSLGVALPGVPSVVIDWEPVIDDLIRHMTTDPRRRRFVFIQGSPGDVHSDEREAGFRRGLTRAGVPVYEEMIVCGNYTVADSMRAVENLIDAGQHFDGIVAANDDMAVGAIATLHAAGLRVPRDVIVAGFDNSMAAFKSVPRLTSAHLDTDRLAELTANLLIGSIRNATTLPPTLRMGINSRLVIRTSSRSFLRDPGAPSPETSATELATEHLQALEPDRAPPGVDVSELAAAAATTIATGDNSLSRAIALSSTMSLADVGWWHNATHQLGHLMAITPHATAAGLAEGFREVARVQRELGPTEAHLRTEKLRHTELQARLMMLIASCSDLGSLFETLDGGLRSLGMEDAWVVINEATQNAQDDGEFVRVAFSLRPSPDLVGCRFHRSAVLPVELGGILERGIHVMVPLRAGTSDIGYLVVEPAGDHLLELEAMASAIAQVLRHVDQVAELDRLAGQDPLTGLPNRKVFTERLTQAIDQRGSNEVAVLLFDLDGFKRVNDTWGHGAGDRLLVTVGERVRERLDDMDLFRLGGDEFTIIATQPEGARLAADAALDVLAAIDQPIVIDGEILEISASIGVASVPHDGDDLDTIVRRADRAMYAAKADDHERIKFARATNVVTT